MIPSTTIVRSKKRKRTVALHVEADGTLTVMAPMRTSLSWINAFIAQKTAWIMRRQRAQAEKRERPPLVLQDGSLIPFLGQELRVVVQNATIGADTTFEDSPSTPCIPITLPADLSPDLVHAEIKTELALWYRKQARRVFQERMVVWAERMNVTPTRLVVTAPRRRWGSCSAKDEIRLNWRMIMLPAELLDYVIVHELCHIPHKNHGKRFWKMVSSFIPDVSEKRQALRKYDKSSFFVLFS